MASSQVEPGGHRDGVFGLARHEGRLLMVRNPRVSGGSRRSWWDLPGGAVRGGEALPEALAREWAEETGLAVEVGDLFLVADGVISVPSLQPLAAGFRASAAALRSIRQNQRRSIGYNALAVMVAAAGLVNPLVAAVLMPLSSGMVIWGASRVERSVG